MAKYYFPCGAIEKVEYVLKAIDKMYSSRENIRYLINFKGHGCLIMCGKGHLDEISDIVFIARPMPEIMKKKENEKL